MPRPSARRKLAGASAASGASRQAIGSNADLNARSATSSSNVAAAAAAEFGGGWPTEALIGPESVSLHGREIPIGLSVAGCDEADPGGRRRASEIPVIVGSEVETIV